MSRMRFKRDSKGIRQLLHSPEIATAISGLAEQVAHRVRNALPDGTDVVVDRYATDRAAASVTIRDRSGKLWEVRDGVLTRAAAGAGLEVKRRG